MLKSCVCVSMLFLCLFACGQKGPDWIPVMEQTSTIFLDDQADKALRSLKNVESHLSPDAKVDVQKDIDDLHLTLAHLKYYYLPMLRAREHAYNAYRLYYLKRQDEVKKHLLEIKVLLEEIARRGDETLKGEMEELIDQAFSVEEALRLRPHQTQERFQTLLVKLNLKALRGDLFLDGEDMMGEDN